MELIHYARYFLSLAELGVILAVAIAGIWGAIQVIRTRDDAFMVIDRSKQNWMLLLGGAAVAALLLGTMGLSLAWIVAAVIVGIYWQDIRPAVRDVLDNSSDW